MAVAKRCDRCGSYYDLVKGQPFSISILNCDMLKTKDVDLCPDCMVELHNWIDGKEFENDKERSD